MSEQRKMQPDLDGKLPSTGMYESYFDQQAERFALLVLGLGLVIRLWSSWGTFLNPDEALHFLIANQISWPAAYRASLTTAHPPLLIFLLYFWRALGTSEFVLRLLSVLAGTGFCWMYFKWLGVVFGRTVGWIGFILVTYLPPMISLSAEVRQYMVMLFLVICCAYLFERALARKSAVVMLLSAVCLYLGMLSHYSGFFFAAAIGIYGLLRLVSAQTSAALIIAWVAGQAGALGIAASLYVTHISEQRGSAQARQAIGEWLHKSYFHAGQDNPLLFVLGKTFGVFQFMCGHLAVGDLAGLLFLIAVVLLFRHKNTALKNDAPAWQLGVFLSLPFLLNCAAAILGVYPYGGTRHCAVLVIPGIAGVSFVLARWMRLRTARGVVVAILVVAFCNAFGTPSWPYMLRRDQNGQQMTQAMTALRQEVSLNDPVFVDYQTSLLLNHYLCPQRAEAMSFDSSSPQTETYDCAGHKIISAGPSVWRFELQSFVNEWNQAVHTYSLKPGDKVWVIQEGWGIQLASELQDLPEFRGLQPQSFGKNITIFELTVRNEMPDSAVE
jgi:hypothetical protein